MIVWKLRGKLSELFCAVLCTTVVHNDTHITYGQFSKVSVGWCWLMLCACGLEQVLH